MVKPLIEQALIKFLNLLMGIGLIATQPFEWGFKYQLPFFLTFAL